MTSRTFERFYPKLGALAALAIWWYLDFPIPPESSFNMALISSLTLAAIFTGFVGTATAVIVGMDSPIMEKIRRSTAIASLTNYITESIVAGIAVSVTAFLLFFWNYPPPLVITGAWIFFIALLTLTFYRISYILIGFLGTKKW
ncbi:hypothetical protein [Thioalkalivibrio sp. ALE9]|uniref:hypothetical protein n=1 Tax=Thioalkalivibrio sp. ALE9 TaxID=1158169 RepID=UPI0012DF3E3C|nr:hypothetical protein [Thioalkalivibrio sp. ALE9]